MLVQILKVAPERFEVASMFFSLYLKNEYMNWADIFHANSDAVIFG